MSLLEGLTAEEPAVLRRPGHLDQPGRPGVPVRRRGIGEPGLSAGDLGLLRAVRRAGGAGLGPARDAPREFYLTTIWGLPLAVPLTGIQAPTTFVSDPALYAKLNYPKSRRASSDTIRRPRRSRPRTGRSTTW